MNAICGFRKCTLTDNELLALIDKLTDDMYRLHEVPSRHVPAQPNKDYDLLVGELLLRFREKFFDQKDRIDTLEKIWKTKDETINELIAEKIDQRKEIERLKAELEKWQCHAYDAAADCFTREQTKKMLYDLLDKCNHEAQSEASDDTRARVNRAVMKIGLATIDNLMESK